MAGLRALIARPGAALAAGMLAAIAVTAGLLWPLPIVLMHERPLSSFNDGHIWAFGHMARLLVGKDPWSLVVPDIGFPDRVEARYIAWLPAVLVAPLQPLLGPIGAYDVALLVAPAVNVLAAWILLQRLARAPWVNAAAALVWALCPYALGSLANGQICKLQMWVLPAWAAALTAVVEGPRPGRALVALALVTTIGSFSEPSYALHLPFLGIAWGLGLLVRGRGRALRRGLLAALVTGACLLPARAAYDPDPPAGTVMAHQPATRVDASIVLTQPSPVATIRETLLGDTPRDVRADVCNHPTYVLIPMLLVALAVGFLRPGWRVAGAATLGVGLAIAAGEHLVGDHDYVRVGGAILAMPARLLAAYGYPLAASGMYYRLAAMAELGVVVLFATGLAGRRGAGVIAGIVAALSVADAVRSTGGLWPRPSAPVAGAATFVAIAADPEPGAVLDLPVYYRAQVGSEMVLATLLHGRASTALPRNVYKDSVPTSGVLDEELKRLVQGDPAAGRATLRAQGFRWVVLHTEPRPPELDMPGLEHLLGPPRVDGTVRAWRLD